MANGANDLTVIDPVSSNILAQVPLEAAAYGVAVSGDSSRTYVALYDGRVAVLDTATNAVVATLSMS